MTDDQKRETCLIVSIGCDRETACKYLGCSLSQLRREMKQDRTFAERLLRAEATPELAHMRNLHSATKDEKNWRASVWWLERRAPERYGRRTPGAVTENQLREVIDELAEVIAGEITCPDDRLRLLRRLGAIVEALQPNRASDSDVEHALAEPHPPTPADEDSDRDDFDSVNLDSVDSSEADGHE